MAMASPAIGQRPYRLLLEPEPPRYLQSLSGPELPPPPPPPGHSSRRCAPAPLSTAPGAHERRGARRAARGDPEPQPRASRPARPLRPGLQQRLRRRPGAPRPRDVRSIFEQPQDPRVPAERGEGHCFVELALRGGRGWCDLCGREVWRRALRCATRRESLGPCEDLMSPWGQEPGLRTSHGELVSSQDLDSLGPQCPGLPSEEQGGWADRSRAWFAQGLESWASGSLLRRPVPYARPGEKLVIPQQPSGMTEGRVEEAASACFGTVTLRLQRLFRRLPKGPWGSLKPQTLPGLRPNARLARDCKFTCHPECRSLIQLDCARQDGASRDRPSPESTLAVTFSQVGSTDRGA
ncbi:hypothetical protein MG293_013319 [Ovis ammon polii]|uniref:Uncharacterized protein n=1 Tax=Ovis ammon polii TaxID=230172 RepID=A0AAD4Y888_OVIAM|nr:hypothetical protein MG293_013319 [Ovis ammon polii]